MKYYIDGFYNNGDKYHTSASCVRGVMILMNELYEQDYDESVNTIDIDSLVITSEKD